jgi:GNAT superfamily N-acetyltransferase
MSPTEALLVRPAEPRDVGTVHELIRALAEYEKLLPEVDATEALLRDALFGARPRVFCDIAEWTAAGRTETAGFALWFYNFSTFRGRHGLYLEDLFVRPAHRGRGIGRALLSQLAQRCLREGLTRLEWSVLDWNEPALRFYASLGATSLDAWVPHRVTGEALRRLAGQGTPASPEPPRR